MWEANLDKRGRTTGCRKFDDLLGGGMPVACLTDVFGAAGTGKTQFAFQNIVTACAQSTKTKPSSVFVDCTGAFRPERIAEIANANNLESENILGRIYTIYVRSVDEQTFAVKRIEKEEVFSECKLVVIDDATSNFILEFGDDEIPARQAALSLHVRNLGVLANLNHVSVLATNSARSRGDMGEKEATGEIFSQFALYRMHFERRGSMRFASLLQPVSKFGAISFEITESGIR